MELFFVFIFGIISVVFSIPLLMIWTHHKRKMEELRQQRQGRSEEAIRAEFAALRAEIQALRDTTMQYDLSFDTALQQADRRLSYLERQARIAPQEPEQQQLTLGGH
jgi:hypothetical protein